MQLIACTSCSFGPAEVIIQLVVMVTEAKVNWRFSITKKSKARPTTGSNPVEFNDSIKSTNLIYLCTLLSNHPSRLLSPSWNVGMHWYLKWSFIFNLILTSNSFAIAYNSFRFTLSPMPKCLNLSRFKEHYFSFFMPSFSFIFDVASEERNYELLIRENACLLPGKRVAVAL